MRLTAVTLQLYRNFVEAQRISIEDDVTCLVGKNESGKTTILKALHRLKPANGDDTTFDLTTEYPRWRLAMDRRKNKSLEAARPVSAEFVLDDDDRLALEVDYGVVIPESVKCRASRSYGNKPTVSLRADLASAAQEAARSVSLDDEDLAKLDLESSIEDLVVTAKAMAKEQREQGETASAKKFTAFAHEIEKYGDLVKGGGTQEQTNALWARVPSFFYFSNYDTLPGETNLTKLAAKVAAGKAIDPRERTVISLLAHAGESPEDFLDDNYDSRKAELQSASIDLSRRVFTYWKQNPDLAVIFDTDNRVVQQQPPNGNEVANRFLKIELRDGRHGDVETNFDTRSTGFQWFFSFFAAFSEYQDSDDSVIVLLDEPGTSLHGDAQHEFVDYIHNELGAAKQTIYTTHSQHMVDPARYEKLRAVHDRATRENPDLGVAVTPPNLSADAATLLPIESALGYSVSRHLFIGSGHHLAVEGSSDFVYLQRFTEHMTSKKRKGLDPRLSIIPVGGADNLPAFVALLGRRLKVSALVDGARTASRMSRITAAAKNNGVPESSIIAIADIPGMPSNGDVEDLFAVDDYLRLYNWAFGSSLAASDLASTDEPILKRVIDLIGRDFDHALPAHALTEHRAEFFANVDPKTVENFAALIAKLNTTLA